MSQMNDGGNGSLSNLTTPGNVISQDQAITVVEQVLGPTMTIVLKGTQASFPGIPAPLIMLAACRVLGKLVGGTFTGMASNVPLKPLMEAREECQRMFTRSIKEIPLMGAGNVGPAVPMLKNPSKQRGE
jgi:hypothetical protein